ncbi:MAG: type III secretion system chaperone [Endozoicomonadaceae bacterium]|nr:type III secretion system chaperone [Endozoicomonadaceae bacterium]
MSIAALMEDLVRINQMDPIEPKEGCYTMRMSGFDVLCYTRSGRIYLEARLAELPEADDEQRELAMKLAEKSLPLIRAQRACISINEEDNHYWLHRRLYESGLRVDQFQETLESFAGCYLYIKEIIDEPTGGGLNPMMIP